jgi:hypothetical protein
VEGNIVYSIESQNGGIAGQLSSLQLHNPFDIFVKLVAYN